MLAVRKNVMADSYIPRVKCLRCQRTLEAKDFKRHYTRRGAKEMRTLTAHCHGVSAAIVFAAEPGQEIELWGE